MLSGAPTLSLATTQLSYTSPTDDPAFNPFADATAETRSSKTGTTGYAGPYSANTPSTSVLRPRRRGSDSLLGRAPLSPTTHARAQTLDISASSPSRPVQTLQRRRSDYTSGNGDGDGDVREEEEGEDADHPLRRRSSSRSVRSVASTKPRLRAALAATRESAEFDEEREARRGREAKRRQEGQRAVLVHQVAPTDSLPGVALKYGITLSDLRKANQLWAHDSIHLRSTLLIPLDQARNARMAVVDAAAEGKDLLSPEDDDARLLSSPEGSGWTTLEPNGSGRGSGKRYGLLSPESSAEPSSWTASPPPRLSQDPSSSLSSRPSRSPTRTRTNHGRAATEPPAAPHLTVTRVPASRLSFFPPHSKPKPSSRVRASEELPRSGGSLLASTPNGRARAGSDLPSPAYGRSSSSTTSRTLDLFSLRTPPASSPLNSNMDYFSGPNTSATQQDALAAAKSLGRVAGRAAGWLADALAIPVPPLPNGGTKMDAVELGSAGKGKDKARATTPSSGVGTPRKAGPATWFTPRPPSPTDSASTASSASLSPFVPPRTKNRRIGAEGDGTGEGIRMASSPPRVQAQPEARRGMVVPTTRR
ncbi:carbohydrate-binding module family 50 protein [Peniophora sp. CONT]|nr:carbohydrate-binding module family 50 protein [Peniophora sp. CONT]